MSKTILCFGDSITWGFNPENAERFNTDQRWTMRLQHKLPDDYIIEEGLNGRTACSDDKLTKVDRNGSHSLRILLDSHQPIDVVIMMIGINDTKSYMNNSVADIRDGVEKLIETCQDPDVYHHSDKIPQILLVSPIHIGIGIKEHSCFEGVDYSSYLKSMELPALFKQLAIKKGCHFVDPNPFISTSTIDNIHLDANGQAKLADLVFDALSKIK